MSHSLFGLALAALLTLPAPAHSQAVRHESPWSLRVRSGISGSSHSSTPDGYTVYSGIALEAELVRRLCSHFALELSLRTESREVEGPGTGSGPVALGSLEMLPMALRAEWRPYGAREHRFQPWAAAGAHLTTTWEKSGALDSINVAPVVGPVVGIGADWILSSTFALTFDARWNALRLTFDDYLPTAPSVRVDPLTLGIGIGVRF